VTKGELIFLVMWEGDNDEGGMDYVIRRETLMKGECIFLWDWEEDNDEGGNGLWEGVRQ
jgi:hypothetical protein